MEVLRNGDGEMYNPYSLKGKKILITGASSGIGRAAAIECSKMGATVFITGRDEYRLDSTLSALEGRGHKSLAIDLSHDGAIDKLIGFIEPIDGLINNAGIMDTLPINFISKEKLSPVLNVNVEAPILIVSKLIGANKIKKNASIVFTSSIAGNFIAHVGNSMYAASKGAVSAFVRAAALELARRKIRVNAVCPGMIHTGIIGEEITEDQLKEDAKKYPLKRYGKPEEVAFAMIYLLKLRSCETVH